MTVIVDQISALAALITLKITDAGKKLFRDHHKTKNGNLGADKGEAAYRSYQSFQTERYEAGSQLPAMTTTQARGSVMDSATSKPIGTFFFAAKPIGTFKSKGKCFKRISDAKAELQDMIKQGCVLGVMRNIGHIMSAKTNICSKRNGLADDIQVSSPHSEAVFSNSFPPSSCTVKEDVLPYMKPLLQYI
ncbi:Glucan endo-1,3-beta-glucosidase 14 [Sesbania bispinosa]|nr:Glucan endo-1,3-beta-glucosidase 14 [Sesbania bispinosa]